MALDFLRLDRFSELPTEIRLRIWNLAYHETNGRIIQVAPRNFMADARAVALTIQTSTTTESLLQVNREARYEVLKRYLTPFSPSLKLVTGNGSPSTSGLGNLLFDPTRDNIFIHDSDGFMESCTVDMLLKRLFTSQDKAVANELRTLAIPRALYTRLCFGESTLGLGLPSLDHIRAIFPKLKTLILQYRHANDRLQGMCVVDFVKLHGFVDSIEIKICDLDCPQVTVEPWFLSEYHGWCSGVMELKPC